MATTYKFASPVGVGDHASIVQQRVYTKPFWTGDWVFRDGIWADRVTWTCSPDMPSSTLFWRYGYGLTPGTESFTEFFRYTGLHRLYTKIIFDYGQEYPNDYQRVWIGTIEADQHTPAGSQLYNRETDGKETTIAAGEQVITAYGLEMLLSKALVLTSETTIGTVNRGLVFNDNNVGNQHPTPGEWKFSNEGNAVKWSTRTIVEYLVQQMPRADIIDLASDLPWVISSADLVLLPDWDEPVVKTHGQSIRAILNQLMPRQRLLSWWVEPEVSLSGELEAETALRVRVATHTDKDIVGTNGDTLKANLNPIIIRQDKSASGRFGTQVSSTDVVDRVRCYGARRTATFSISLAAMDKWTDAQELSYEAGYSTRPDYPGDDEVTKSRILNQRVRSLDENSMVFRTWGLPLTFDGKLSSLGPVEVHIDPSTAIVDSNVGHPFFMNSKVKLLPELRLREGEDYSGDRISMGQVVDDETKDFLRPFVYCVTPLPNDSYYDVTKFGNLTDVVIDEEADNQWSASVRVKGRFLHIVVSGARQHVIANGTFDPIGDQSDAEDEEGIPILDWREFVTTIAVETDSYAVGVYPDPDIPIGETDSVREVAIYLGDNYRKDFVPKDTIVGLEDDFSFYKQTDKGGWVRDDEDKLKTIAEIAYNWYSRYRQSITFDVIYQRPAVTPVNRPLAVGDLVESYEIESLLDDEEVIQSEVVNSAITWMQITSQRTVSRGNESVASPVRMAFSTAFANLDVQAFVPQR